MVTGVEGDSDEAVNAGEGSVPVASNAKEARLVRMLERLRERMEATRAENEQLEELLHQADARVQGGSGVFRYSTPFG